MRNAPELLSSLHLHVQSYYQGPNSFKLLPRAFKLSQEIPRYLHCWSYGFQELKRYIKRLKTTPIHNHLSMNFQHKKNFNLEKLLSKHALFEWLPKIIRMAKVAWCELHYCLINGINLISVHTHKFFNLPLS